MKFKNIFHIDNDPDDTEFFFAAALEACSNVSVDVFFDARRALEKLSDMSIIPDAIFLDLNMPMMDGFQFLKEIKCLSGAQSIPIIILSTSSQPETIDAAKKMGAEGFITKPSDYYQLVDILKSYL
ncbi:response regulator receiver domain-containing protein [Flavobacterium sp. 270]|uniref:response regulator n=1 Tax=Flavobacterium sp. 270 TaxID=2512114 RepID=UPI001066ACA8|nr:response regulator [Flavobacterium sp. 270]TDW46652.1 response regulator receiver domain-containing protein [Flavobacterium sp. 270]